MAIPILSLLTIHQYSEMKKQYSVVILLATLTVGSVGAFTIQESKGKNPCRIHLSYPHISTNLTERQGIQAVKVNAYSVCNRPHSKISLSVQLWKENLVFKELLLETVAREPRLVPAGKRFYNENTFVPCLNRESTKYFGVAFGKALIQGKWYVARDEIEVEIPPLKCGT